MANANAASARAPSRRGLYFFSKQGRLEISMPTLILPARFDLPLHSEASAPQRLSSGEEEGGAKNGKDARLDVDNGASG